MTELYMNRPIIPITKLEHIMSFSNTYSCGDTQDFIASALSNNWDDETLSDPKPNQYYNKHWISNHCHGEYINEDLIEEIIQHLDDCGYITIDIDYGKYDHAFVVCNTEKGQVIIDSYVRVRKVECRPIDLRQMLLRLLHERSISTWNDIFNVNMEDQTQHNLDITYSYNDGIQDELLQVNGDSSHPNIRQ